MNTTKKVIKDMFIEQLNWSWWFIGINVLIHLGMSYYSLKYNFNISDFSQFISASITIYMLVIGIIAGSSFLKYYTCLGVTRKDYFYGAAFAAIILSFALIIIADIFAIIELSIFNLMNVSIESNIFNGMNWVKPTFFIGLNGLIYYLTGWFINLGYYRFNRRIGLFFIFVSLLIISIHGSVWADHAINVPVIIIGSTVVEIMKINAVQLSFGVSMAITSLLIIMIIYILRVLTKNISIKL